MKNLRVTLFFLNLMQLRGAKEEQPGKERAFSICFNLQSLQRLKLFEASSILALSYPACSHGALSLNYVNVLHSDYFFIHYKKAKNKCTIYIFCIVIGLSQTH